MTTKGSKLKAFYAESQSSAAPVSNHVQETHRRKIQADIARTKTFILQADKAIEQLQQSLGRMASPEGDGVLPAGWTPETLSSAQLLALHEVYRQLPYTPMKNDLIGIASAVQLTLDAVHEQRDATQALRARNEADGAENGELLAILRDYQAVEAALGEQVAQYPHKLAKLEQKIRDSGPYSQEVERKIEAVSETLKSAKLAEERMYAHLQRVVMRIYALVDWKHANVMDEETFRKSITSSVALVNALVMKLVENGGDSEANWISVSREAAEGRLIEVMIRNNVLTARDVEGSLEVKLLDLGQ